MSKRAQQNQSAFDVGNKIGLAIYKTEGKLNSQSFNKLFNKLYTGSNIFQSIAMKAACISYANALDKAAKAAQPEPLTGEQNA